MLSLFLATALATQTPAKAPTADDYVGRWNVKITDAEDTFVSGGFQVDSKAGVLSGGLVWRWGSFGPVKTIEVKDGALLMVREETAGKPDRFEARVEAGVLKGQVSYPDGKIHHFEGRKAPLLTFKVPSSPRSMVHLAGTVSPALEDGAIQDGPQRLQSCSQEETKPPQPRPGG